VSYRRRAAGGAGLEVGADGRDHPRVGDDGEHSQCCTYCSEVIEHLRDFKPFVRALARLTAERGLVYLTTPDAGDFRLPRDLERWPEIKPPEHLSWFRRRHLADLFGAEGLAVRFQVSWKPGIRMLARRPSEP